MEHHNTTPSSSTTRFPFIEASRWPPKKRPPNNTTIEPTTTTTQRTQSQKTNSSNNNSSSSDDRPGLEEYAIKSLKNELRHYIKHDANKMAYLLVHNINPALVDDEEHLLGFLRVEDFNVELAAKRLLRYWEERYKYFGPNRFALPMTLDGAMKESIDSIRLGFYSLLPACDDLGRAIIFNNTWSKVCLDANGCFPIDADEKMRVLWYLVHVAKQKSSVGYVMLANARNSNVGQFNSKNAVIAGKADRIFPFQCKMRHVCHANDSFNHVAMAVKAVLDLSQRETFALHDGSDECVLESLLKYSIPKHCIPTCLGGTHELDPTAFMEERYTTEAALEGIRGCLGGTHELDPTAFMEERYTIEAAAKASNAEPTFHPPGRTIGSIHNMKADSSHTLDSGTSLLSFGIVGGDINSGLDITSIKAGDSSLNNFDNSNVKSEYIHLKQDSAISLDSCLIGDGERKIEHNNMKQSPAPFPTKAVSNGSIEKPNPESNDTLGRRKRKIIEAAALALSPKKKDAKDEAKACEETGKKKKSECKGRTGDPRMNNAVEAKLNNTDMSLVAALVAGGFVFPGLEQCDKLNSLVDEDGIGLYQRRNQLLRRLRKSKAKEKEVTERGRLLESWTKK